jgi:hypothetical protein
VSGAVYAPVGPWWTLDAPSLRLPTRDGDRVSIWTVGDGPSLLLVPRPGEDHRAWLPLLPCLQDRFTLHALQWSRPDRPSTTARDVAVAVAGLGVRRVIADGDGAAATLEVLRADRAPSVLVAHGSGLPADAAAGTAVVLHRTGAPADHPADDPAQLADVLAGLLDG